MWPSRLRVPLSQAYGVVTFYHYFSMKPPGRHTCTICTGTACYIKGADKVVAQTEKHLHIKVGETTPDGNISLTTARCVGACGRAPVALMDGDLVGPDSGRRRWWRSWKDGPPMNSEELQQIAEAVQHQHEQFDYEVNVCMGTGCLSQHSDKVKDALTKEAEASGKRCHVRRTGCMGLCAAGPLALVDPIGTALRPSAGVGCKGQ